MATLASDFNTAALMEGRTAVELICDDADLAERVLKKAALAIERIRHPEEPDDSLVNFISCVYKTDVGAWFRFDAPDLVAWPKKADSIMRVLVKAVDVEGLEHAALRWTDREPLPVAPRSQRLDRDTPIALPAGFPLPANATLTTTRLYALPHEWEAAHWAFYGAGDPQAVLGEFHRALEATGYEQGAFEHPTEWRMVGVSEVVWSLRSDLFEGHLRWGAVLAEDLFREHSLRAYEEFAWVDEFARGEGWQLLVSLLPGAADWRPY